MYAEKGGHTKNLKKQNDWQIIYGVQHASTEFQTLGVFAVTLMQRFQPTANNTTAKVEVEADRNIRSKCSLSVWERDYS